MSHKIIYDEVIKDIILPSSHSRFNLSICYNSMKISCWRNHTRKREEKIHINLSIICVYDQKTKFQFNFINITQLTSHRRWPKVNVEVIFQWNT